MIPWADRTPVLHSPSKFMDLAEWKDYLVNTWIPTQPDQLELMRLFLLCNFSPAPFVACIKFGTKPEEQNEKVQSVSQ